MKLKNVFISTYTFVYDGIRTNNSGPVIPLMKFFHKYVNQIILVEQPLPGSETLKTRLTVFNNGKCIQTLDHSSLFPIIPRKADTTKTYLRLKIRDILSSFYLFYVAYPHLKKDKIDLFIGVECINAIFGIFLKKIGLVNVVVYYIFDWAPDRYSNSIMNRLYILLDKVAAYYSDYTWNITYTIGEARKNILGYNIKKMSPQLYVPYCVDFDESNILADSEIDSNLIVYSGGLIEENGPHILLEAFKIVYEKHPEAKLLIIGGGGIEDKLRNFISINKLQDNVEITGYISEQSKIVKLQSKGAIGVAPYPFIKGSRKPYGDVIKIRMYIACGLVTVTTAVPPVSKEIKEEKLGYTTLDDSAEELAKGISLFLSDKQNFFDYRHNVIEKAKTSSWENNYSSSLKQMSFELAAVSGEKINIDFIKY